MNTTRAITVIGRNAATPSVSTKTGTRNIEAIETTTTTMMMMMMMMTERQSTTSSEFTICPVENAP